MGRSVSYPYNAEKVCFWGLYDDDLDEDLDFEFFYLKEWIVEEAKRNWPSLYDCDKWVGREDHAILENQFCYIGVSEYCGVVAIWLLSKQEELCDDGHSDAIALGNLAGNWCSIIAPKFDKSFKRLIRIATFSNGESVYELETEKGYN